MTFQGKKVMVTGGTGAIGTAVSSAFLEAGADVYSSYIVAEELDRLPADLENSDRFHTDKVNLLDETEVQAWFEKVGTPYVVANIAGGFDMAAVKDTELSAWQKMIDINLSTCFLTSRQALRAMDAVGEGRIVNVASFAAVQRIGGMAAYTTAKRAVIALTEAMAEETLATKITVNAILPTIMDTPANRTGMPDADFSTWVPGENVAKTILFLADPSSWHITGASLPLRGHS
ncbi:SDR family oxidoreductase [Sulfidibacter corallicola]|uniref:SDR family oxidoreductase n=1 Tax=Sulfidibacter corallicola TaxID=2818388 RepID=A0A8A4TPM2_SULCO|nr:SDR family NAD(P)-dependent oxidoreductase [Sulfidibacter corallicola]QTD51493.1 SDR family oxidoreductase [Sulfidibacter corallicola]